MKNKYDFKKRGPFLYEFESPSPNDDLCQGSDLGFEQTLKFPAQECFVPSLPVVKICPMVLEDFWKLSMR